MTPSRLDCHFFKGAYLIGLNHIIFCADEIGLKGCLLNWAYKWPTEQGLNGAYSTGLTNGQLNKAESCCAYSTGLTNGQLNKA